MKGWIKLHRKLCLNDLWIEKPFDKARAWIDLLLLANYQDGIIFPRGIQVKVVRGQVGWSIKALAARWGWSQGKVKRCFAVLEKMGQIRVENGDQNNNVTSLITLINYNLYQIDGEQTESKRRANGEQTETKKKIKKVKKVKKEEENPPSPLDTGVSEAQNLAKFNAFYALYLRKEAKQDALKAWTTLTPNEALLSIILEALKKHKEVWIAEGRETKHIPLPATWIRGRRWEDEIAPKNDWRNNPKGTPLPDRTRHNLAVMDALAREREEKAIEQKRLQEGEKENERLGQS